MKEVKLMTLLEQWRQSAYEVEMNDQQAQMFWVHISHRKKAFMKKSLQTRK